ncbi:hypothetical protein KIK84_11670 [Curvibacter sp. CHRR-16]|uniref:hypothetical protein n=1 Tax=Curvibacter sp. CHRR-16 TaxID=2835872 RepID=UPI001BDB0481|nr:hypothetical protein [Curvibacter sp. CHRR-16]MBT0570990.1 hypothetical protein [Curvibacter sp. CHRR-16]
MNRCFSLTRWTGTLALVAACLSLAVPSSTLAQTLTGTTQVTNAQGQTVTIRTFPANSKRGDLQVTNAPVVLLDGKADRLSPGARIRNTNNLLMLSASLTGQTVPVMYRRESTGMLHEVWLLTADEAEAYPAEKRYFIN